MKRFLGVLFSLVLMFSLVASPGAVHAASYTVTNTSDSGAGSLRQAILDANANPGTDTINFNIPGAGPHTIKPLSALPTITDPVIIDGYTEPGSSPNTNGPGLGINAVLMIELDGTNAGDLVDGLYITAGDSTVRGLVINRFGGGVTGGLGGCGVRVSGNGGNVIEGNFIGTDINGTVALGNSHIGVLILWSSNNIIGGTTAEARNLISANVEDGVHIQGDGVTGNVVQGNLIGTDVTGTAALGNSARGVAIFYWASNNMIGGTTAGALNVISGNGYGVVLLGDGVTDNLVQGNFIGTDVTGTTGLGNFDGVHITGADNNTIGGTTAGTGNIISANSGAGVSVVNATGNLVQGNTITLNGADGVRVGDVYGNIGTANAILSNSIFSNGGLGIDLDEDGVTPNDPGDSDNGSNNLQNFPVLTSATSGSTTIEGMLNSTPNTEFRLEFFSNSVCDPSGYGEGETFLGSIDVTTDSNGDASFAVTIPDTVPVGHFITATATDPNNNTSEFSACLQVTTATVEATVDFDPDTLNLKGKGKWITVYIELPEGYDVYDININTVVLNGEVPAESDPKYGFVRDPAGRIGDYDDDGTPDCMVKFDRSAVQGILGVGDAVEITVTGQVAGTPFEGSDIIRVK